MFAEMLRRWELRCSEIIRERLTSSGVISLHPSQGLDGTSWAR